MTIQEDTQSLHSQKIAEIIAKQRDAFISEGYVSAETRIERINRCIDLILDNAEAINEAINSDFASRCRETTLIADVAMSVEALKNSRRHLKKWMKPEKRSTMFPLNLLGARSTVEYQPLGVIGIVAPWNFPVSMIFSPLANALAAGNRAVIKPSEYTPATSDLMAKLIGEAFDESEIAVVTGGADVGAAFTAQAFDHLIFTGATGIARHVMRAASENLVPVTLELGGKSPVIATQGVDKTVVAERIMAGKLMNAGQICLAPDYFLVPEYELEEWIDALKAAAYKFYPTMLDNADYTAVITDRHVERLNSYIEEAEQSGSRVESLAPADEHFAGNAAGKVEPRLVVNPNADSLIMNEEIFGPLMPVLGYRDVNEVIHLINGKDRPLALYIFSDSEEETRYILDRTHSGGVCLNDVIMHVTQDDLPFGGVGPSGMGVYHGFDGFKTFSNARAVYKQTKFNVAKLGGLVPPYGKATEMTLKTQLKK